ncbi:Mu transposase C-terminal domain-containing protein [Methylomonas sp. MS20]|uniref:Mu transposase C-terminal domain-containing protein n=1 Tax=Methylomonas sp. MS20 TaxID=3418769 RepID=UPI003D012573
MSEKNPLLCQEQRKVRRGEITVMTNRYWASELIAFDGINVSVVFDITDASKVVILDLDGKFLCLAYPSCGFFPVSFLTLAQEKRRAAQEARVNNHTPQPFANARPLPPVHSLEGIDVSCPHCQGLVRVNIQASKALPLASDAVDLAVIQDQSHVE